MAQYGRPEYWNERYTHDANPFDWYQRWSGLKNVISEYLNVESKILIVGCGTSRLSEDLFDQGFTNITNIDLSSVCIQIMKDKYTDTPKASMPFKEMDVTDMSDYSDQSFDVVIDKATLDSLLCGDNSADSVPKMTSEISRVLKDDGRFITVSYGQPLYRLKYLEREDNKWHVNVKSVPKPTIPLLAQPVNEKDNVHYIYICSKDSKTYVSGDVPLKTDDA